MPWRWGTRSMVSMLGRLTCIASWPHCQPGWRALGVIVRAPRLGISALLTGCWTMITRCCEHYASFGLTCRRISIGSCRRCRASIAPCDCWSLPMGRCGPCPSSLLSATWLTTLMLTSRLRVCRSRNSGPCRHCCVLPVLKTSWMPSGNSMLI